MNAGVGLSTHTHTHTHTHNQDQICAYARFKNEAPWVQFILRVHNYVVVKHQNQNELYCHVCYTYEEFVFMTEATAVQQNDSDRTKTQIIKEQVNKE